MYCVFQVTSSGSLHLKCYSFFTRFNLTTSVAEPEPPFFGRRSRLNCAHKVNVFHSFFITLHGKIKDWFKLKNVPSNFFLSLYTPPESESEPPKLRSTEPEPPKTGGSATLLTTG